MLTMCLGCYRAFESLYARRVIGLFTDRVFGVLQTSLLPVCCQVPGMHADDVFVVLQGYLLPVCQAC